MNSSTQVWVLMGTTTTVFCPKEKWEFHSILLREKDQNQETDQTLPPALLLCQGSQARGPGPRLDRTRAMETIREWKWKVTERPGHLGTDVAASFDPVRESWQSNPNSFQSGLPGSAGPTALKSSIPHCCAANAVSRGTSSSSRVPTTTREVFHCRREGQGAPGTKIPAFPAAIFSCYK